MMVAEAYPVCGLHKRQIAEIGNSAEVLPGQSSESLPTKSTEQLNKVQLKRELGLFSAVNLCIGCMIGSGIFVSPSIALERAGSVPLCLIIWAVCGVITLLEALTFAELSCVVPRSGAEYSFLMEAFGSLHKFWGPLPGFACAFINVFVISPTASAIIIMTFSEYVCQPFAYYMADLTPESQDMVKKLIGILGLGLLTFINVMSVKLYVQVQNAFSICKLVVCGVVIGCGVFVLCTGSTENLSQGFDGSTTSPENLALAFYGCLWSYGGWSTITTITEEVKKPEVNVLRSILIALPLVTAVYLMMNVAYMTVLTVPEMIAAPAVAVVFGDRILGVMKFIIPVGVALSTFGCALSSQFAVARLCYVAGREGHMLAAFSYIHVRRLTPAPAVILQGLLAFLFIISGDIKSLIDFCSFLVWVFYALAMVALMVMRRTKKHVERTCKVPLFIPVLVIIVALFLCLVPIITDPSPKYFIAPVLIGLACILYVPLVYYKFRPEWISGLNKRQIAETGNSAEVLPGQSSESLPTKSTEQLNKVQLKRELGLFSAVNLSIGCMIGSGIFVSPSIALERAGSVPLCLIIWAVCGAITLLEALTFAELSCVVPRSGAEYSFLMEAFGSLHKFWGPLPGFASAFINVFAISPTVSAIIIMTFSEYVCQPFAYYMADLTPESQDMVKKLIGILGLGLLTFINVMSVKLYVQVQNAFSICKLVVCGVVIGYGVFVLCTGSTENLSQGFDGSTTSPENLALAFYGCLWSYGGWSTITSITEEVKKPEVNVLRSILIALPLVTAVYVMMNVAYMTVLTVPEMIAAPAVAVVFGDRFLGVMKFIIPVGVALSTFGSALSSQFSVARLCYVAGREGHMLAAFSYIHVRRLTPAPAVILQGLLAFLFIISGDIKSLIDFCSFLIWVFYALAMVALMVMRRTKKHVERTCKVPLFIPVLVIIVALFLCLVPIITDPSPKYFIAPVLIGLACILYVPLVYYKFRPEWINKLTYFVQVLMEVVPAERSME